MIDFVQRFNFALASLPAPGGGGCHTAILGAANYAAMAGLNPDAAANAIHAAIPQGGRCVPVREVRDAVRKAFTDYENAPKGTIPRRSPRHAPERPEADSGRFWREALVRWPQDSDPVAELWERSPIRLDWPPEEDAGRLIEALYGPDERLFIGGNQEPGILGGNIRSARDWLACFAAGGTPGPHIIPNPLTGRDGPTKSGGVTLRGDSCVAAWRFVIVEFDGKPKHEQAAFWLALDLPVAVILDSGGKSLHGWVRVDCRSAREWEERIEQDVFPNLLVPLGADRACKNESRMSRTPGVRRGDNWQRLLYLNPSAGSES